MTTNKLATVALASLMIVAGAAAAPASAAGALPDAAYFLVDLNYCTPMAPLSGARPTPTGDVAVVYNEVLVGAYGGDCKDFYAKEVLPRLYLSYEGS